MNALVAREGKLKPVLSGHVFRWLMPTGAAKADQPVGEQRRDLGSTLRRGHVLGGLMVDWQSLRTVALSTREVSPCLMSRMGIGPYPSNSLEALLSG